MKDFFWWAVRAIAELYACYQGTKLIVDGILEEDSVVSGFGGMMWCIMLIIMRL